MQNNAGLKFYIVDTLASITQNDWDSLFGNSCVEGYGYHKTLEESKLNEFSLHYCIGKRFEKTIAIVPFFTMDFSATTIVRGKLQNIIFNIRKLFNRFLKIRILFIGTPAAECLYIGISKEENNNLVFENILGKISEFSQTQKIRTMAFYNLIEEHNELKTYLTQKGFHLMESFPNSQMNIKYSNVEDYISTFGSSTRKDVRRKLRKSASLVKLETQLVDNVEKEIDEIYKLYIYSLKGSDLQFETFTPQFFLNINRNMPGVAKYFITRDNGKIVAFNLCFIKNNLCIDKVIGFDYECAHRYSLYYTTFFHNVEWCIKNGVQFYQPGQGDYDPKIRLGAKLIPLAIYIKTTNPLLNLFIKQIIKLLEPKKFDPTLKNLSKYKITDAN